jgi:ribosome recycling factor
MSQEYRDTMVKQVHSMAESAKIKIRNHRQDARTALKKRKSMPQDESRRLEKEIQELTDKTCHKADAASKEKIIAIQKS